MDLKDYEYQTGDMSAYICVEKYNGFKKALAELHSQVHSYKPLIVFDYDYLHICTTSMYSQYFQSVALILLLLSFSKCERKSNLTKKFYFAFCFNHTIITSLKSSKAKQRCKPNIKELHVYPWRWSKDIDLPSYLDEHFEIGNAEQLKSLSIKDFQPLKVLQRAQIHGFLLPCYETFMAP